jgi:H+-transporting ATPase
MPGRWLLIATSADILFIAIISWLGILVTPVGIQYVAIALGLTFVSMLAIDQAKNLVFAHYGM